MSEKQGVSIRPSDASKGGVLSDVDAEFKKVKWVDEATYNNGETYEGLFLQVEFETEDGSETQHYSAGKLEYFEPSEDGKRAIPNGSASTLRENCNAVQLFASIVNAGWPEDKLSDDVSVFEGLKAHMVSVPQVKRSGMASGDKEKTIPVVEKLLNEPWNGGGKSAKSKGKSAKAEKTAKESSGDVEEKAIETINEILAGEGEAVKTTSLFGKIMKALKTDPDKKAVVQMAGNVEFLQNQTDHWIYDEDEETIEAV